jgi:osmotically-inducible protein OsmY
MKTSRWIYTLSIAWAVALLAVGCSKLPEPVTSTAPNKEAQVPVANLPDLDVTEHVKMALQQNESLKPFNISVITLKGDVRVIGVLDTQGQIDEAIKIARTSAGTHTVHDELTLKK